MHYKDQSNNQRWRNCRTDLGVNLRLKSKERERNDKETPCSVCGRISVLRLKYCTLHLKTEEIERRERETRHEIMKAAGEAAKKIELGLELSPREREILESQRIVKERFGGEYPPPAPRSGRVAITPEGNIVEDYEVAHLRSRDYSVIE